MREFGSTAKVLSRNPLGIIALFLVLVYGLACLVVIAGGSLTTSERLPIIYLLVVFPFVVLGVFTYLVAFRAGQLFAPGDFRKEETYLELQKMRVSAAVSLTAAGQFKNRDGIVTSSTTIDNAVERADKAVRLSQKGVGNPFVLWVDDNPSNNIYERKALEAVGIQFILSENTGDALEVLSTRSFGAIISDMGRREGSREGYVLLDELRARGDDTPLFIYASSNSLEHRRETRDHRGQGCTNDGQELFDMITKVVFGPQPPRRSFHVTRRDLRKHSKLSL